MEEGANCCIYDVYKLDVYIQICSTYLLPIPSVLFMTCKSSSEQSFKLTGIALMIVKVLREMGDTETESIISSLSAGGHHTSPQHYQQRDPTM